MCDPYCSWKYKDVHDILVECAQLSLDLVDGSCGYLSAASVDHPLNGNNVLNAFLDFTLSHCTVCANVTFEERMRKSLK